MEEMRVAARLVGDVPDPPFPPGARASPVRGHAARGTHDEDRAGARGRPRRAVRASAVDALAQAEARDAARAETRLAVRPNCPPGGVRRRLGELVGPTD